MLKIPKQIYFDEPMLTLYSQYAQKQGISFSAAVRNVLAAYPPKLKQVKKHPSTMILIKSRASKG